MEWLIIPAILIGLMVVFGLLAIKWGDISWVLLILALPLFLAMITCPTNYYKSRNRAWAMEQYYIQVIQPNVISEGVDFVVVSNIEAGVWQAGDVNIYGYNKYLVTTRYWQEIPLIKTAIYSVPEHLKFARISK
jgi:hypothetical protein